MGNAGGQGSWLAELAHADLDVARGRPRQAEQRILKRLADDERAKNSTAVAHEYALLAEIAASEHRAADVMRFADRGRRASLDPQFTYRFALALFDVGRIHEAKRLADTLSQSSNIRASLYRRPLEAEIAASGARQTSGIMQAAQDTGTWWAYLSSRCRALTDPRAGGGDGGPVVSRSSGAGGECVLR